jgi:hypothetical protein
MTTTSYRRLALLGAPGSGKTSIAVEWAALRTELDSHDAMKVGFADELRLEASSYMGRVISDDWHRSPGRNGSRREAQLWLMTQFQHPATKDRWRPLLQWWGTDFRRDVDEDYWCEKVAERITRFEAINRGLPRGIVVDDCRFPNEYAMLRERGFTFVRLLDGETTRDLTTEQREHESEAYWPTFEADIELDYVLGPDIQAQRIIAITEGGQSL